MSNNNGYYRETVERYCHIIGKNTAFDRYSSISDSYFECKNRDECEKNGGCKHHIFSKTYKEKEG